MHQVGAHGFVSLIGLACLLLLWSAPVRAQQAPPAPAGPIQDNSFLIEEAYNQEAGVVQHIGAFVRFWKSRDLDFTFTQEWPVPGNWRHQLSYTLPVQHAGSLRGSGIGVGDVLLNYRYQIVGDGDSRLAVAPRFSLAFSSGDEAKDRGAGGLGYQTNLPLSYVITPKVIGHTNVGLTVVPSARNAEGDSAKTTAISYGQSVIWLVHPRINLMLEAVGAAAQGVDGEDQTSWSRSFVLSPGLRWSYDFANGLQIVPGVAVPIGLGPTSGDRAVILYLSFEHPFK